MDTADSVMDTKKKLEFGVQQIMFKVGELVKGSNGQVDEQLKNQLADITRTILSNQTEALANLTNKVEKEIGKFKIHVVKGFLPLDLDNDIYPTSNFAALFHKQII